MKRAIHWFRRDLRVHDNTAFSIAAEKAETIIPIFVFEEALRTGRDVGAARLAFLIDSVRVLGERLSELGYPLVVRFGRSEVELPKLAKELRAEAVFCNKRYEPYAQQRDRRVEDALSAIGVGFESFKDAVLFEEREILTKAGEPYTVFTPYSKAWLANFRLPKLRKLKKRAPFTIEVRSEKFPNGPEFFGQQLNHPTLEAGEEVAAARLDEFVGGRLAEYSTGRDDCSVDGTSKLSAHLRAGTVSIREIWGKVLARREQLTGNARASCDVFLKELIWREFYLQILHNFPHVMRGNFRREYDRLEWSNNAEHLRRWQEGATGYPIVDAAMRCLNATGWMHNRLRMITAMFLTKDLLINWQEGERYFMQRLVDGDMAANNGGWQWSAGTGTDAAPYFRIFNPVTQSRKVDPTGEFIRTWVPELRGFDAKSVHEPWVGKNPPRDYPDRVVIHEDQRPKALAMYEKLKTRRSPLAD
ncbi:MAG TPA: deoxyribodipyrimidine photo-lyase [Verrucomicrobiae bacterium]